MIFGILTSFAVLAQVPPAGASVELPREAPDRDIGAAVVVNREAWLMGSRIRLEFRGPDRPRVLALSERALEELGEWEARISTWRESSDYLRVNRSEPGVAVTVDPSAAELLREALDWFRVTKGAFDPLVGDLVEAWGFRGQGQRPPDDQLARLRKAREGERLRVDPSTGAVVRTTTDALIDAGAFGKGAALRTVAVELAESGNLSVALVDMGGQLWVYAPGADPWSIRIAHPTHRDRSVGTLELSRGSVATSGTSERSVVVDGERFGHILDPRTGRPAPAWGSVTVVADDPLEADILATALYVMGPEEGMRWIQEHRPTLAALFLVDSEEGLTAVLTGRMEEFVDRLSADIETIQSTPKG